MQIILLAALITLAIWAWPVTLVCLGIWLIFIIIRAIFRSSRKKKKTVAVKSVATRGRVSLHNDWELLISTIVGSLKQHWDVLEDKFGQYVDEDDYGNKFIDDRYSKEIIYFSHKIVQPTLDKLIDGGNIKANSFALLPSPSVTLEDLYNIKYKDSDTTIAGKYVREYLERTVMTV